ncbi:MAG: DNA internalization-related competence protein ComEC/Rec2, partial [Paraglaciecola sp.]|nr:DNA internalization-related competence protein ComEC/Rec2 [Paraglaciecola sp.]
ISTVSPLVNLIAVPVVTIVLVPLCLMAVICLVVKPDWALALFSLADLIMDYGLSFLDFALKLDAAYFTLPALSAGVWLCVFLFVFCCCLPSFWLHKKYLCLLLLPPMSYLFTQKANTWQIDILDVGQGAAVLITKNNHVMIYDVGASYPSGFNMADSVLLPILQARGLSNVDLVFISHGDNDHAGSLPQLRQGIQVAEVLTNRDSCKQGLDMFWQGLKIEAFWPDNASNYSDNNGSCVIKISDRYHSILLPGDIDKSIEKQLIVYYPEQLQADILLAPHHGSNTSSSSGFIQAVSAKFVVFSQGFMSRWRFPRPEVVNRYKGYNPQLFSTSSAGQVSFTLQYDSPKSILVNTFRQDIYPYWYANSRQVNKISH